MAREIRVPAAPDFPITIFIEFQTNVMSTDGINEMSAQAPKKIPQENKKSALTNRQPQIKKVLERVWGNLFLKKVSPATCTNNIL